MNSPQYFWVVPIVVGLVLLGPVACTPSATQTSITVRTGKVTVTATEMAFLPKEVKIPVRESVAVRLENKGKVLHDWNVEKITVTAVKENGSASHGRDGHEDTSSGAMTSGGMTEGRVSGLNNEPILLHVAADVGQVAQIEFTPSSAGTYIFYCSVAGHREAGMEGRLIVE